MLQKCEIHLNVVTLNITSFLMRDNGKTEPKFSYLFQITLMTRAIHYPSPIKHVINSCKNTPFLLSILKTSLALKSEHDDEIGSWILKASAVKCWSITSIDPQLTPQMTLYQHLTGILILIFADMQWSVDEYIWTSQHLADCHVSQLSTQMLIKYH